MGADGGVEWMFLDKPDNYKHLCELLKPFWQIGWRGDKSGCAGTSVDAHIEWLNNNSTISPPHCLVGFYGTDRGDHCSLGTLSSMLNFDEQPLCDFTLRELDLYFRNSWDMDSWSWSDNPWYQCWKEHFGWLTEEEACEQLGSLKDMIVLDWVKEVGVILNFVRVYSAETWT